MTATECKSNFKHTTETPYLALMGKLLGVYSKNFEENWQRYNGTTLGSFALFIVISDYIFKQIFIKQTFFLL